MTASRKKRNLHGIWSTNLKKKNLCKTQRFVKHMKTYQKRVRMEWGKAAESISEQLVFLGALKQSEKTSLRFRRRKSTCREHALSLSLSLSLLSECVVDSKIKTIKRLMNWKCDFIFGDESMTRQLNTLPFSKLYYFGATPPSHVLCSRLLSLYTN